MSIRNALWAAVVGKARDDWEFEVSVGAPELDERLIQKRFNFFQECVGKKCEGRLQAKPSVPKELLLFRSL